METKTLNSETFKAVQELANLTMNIAEARDTLAKAQTNEIEYFAERERKVQTLIGEVVATSKEALEEVEKNHEALLDVTRKARDVLTQAQACSELVRTFSEEFTTYMQQENDKLTVKKNLIDAMIFDMKKERVKIDADRECIENEQRGIIAIKTRLASDRAGVQAAWNAVQHKESNHD